MRLRPIQAGAQWLFSLQTEGIRIPLWWLLALLLPMIVPALGPTPVPHILFDLGLLFIWFAFVDHVPSQRLLLYLQGNGMDERSSLLSSLLAGVAILGATGIIGGALILATGVAIHGWTWHLVYRSLWGLLTLTLVLGQKRRLAVIAALLPAALFQVALLNGPLTLFLQKVIPIWSSAMTPVLQPSWEVLALPMLCMILLLKK
ncbi:hypothetical protein H8D30_03940 [bacterium]|nr:hypothetical protein [bacterium]